MDSSPTIEPTGAGLADTGALVVPPEQAIHQADIATTDLQTMNEAEVAKVLPSRQQCRFAYVEDGRPVLATGVAAPGGILAVIKLHGDLIVLRPRRASDLRAVAVGPVLTADGIAIAVRPEGEAEDGWPARIPADLLFKLQEGLTVGYAGFWTCSAASTG